MLLTFQQIWSVIIEYVTTKFAKSIIILTSCLGILIMGYLTYVHYANARTFCDISETVSCDVVTTSIYSELFGVPLALLGLLFFGFVLFLSLTKPKTASYKALFFLTLLVLGPSFYLTFAEIFLIKAFCILCESSKVLMIIILACSFHMSKLKFKVALRMSIPVVIAGITFAFVTYFAQTSSATMADYSSFAEALNAKGVIYYKSFKCSNCKRQELLFGVAYKKLNSVECHPDGPNADAPRCLRMKISKTPTFLIEQDGVELKRLEGLQQLETIADWAEVEFVEER